MPFFHLVTLYFVGILRRIKILLGVDRCGPRSNILFLIPKEVVGFAGDVLTPLLPQRQLCSSLAACLSITSLIFINLSLEAKLRVFTVGHKANLLRKGPLCSVHCTKVCFKLLY